MGARFQGAMAVPQHCSIRGCVGTLKPPQKPRGVFFLQCDVAVHHRAWRVPGGWMCTTRQRPANALAEETAGVAEDAVSLPTAVAVAPTPLAATGATPAAVPTVAGPTAAPDGAAAPAVRPTVAGPTAAPPGPAAPAVRAAPTRPGFGGQTARASSCQACQYPRDAAQRGTLCNFCKIEMRRHNKRRAEAVVDVDEYHCSSVHIAGICCRPTVVGPQHCYNRTCRTTTSPLL